MTAAELTLDSPFHHRFFAYLRERFPLIGHGILIFSYYSSNQFLAKALTRPGETMHYDLASLAGIVMLLCFFFHLRVFDEHKDFAEDSMHYPDRVLQRGLVTLRHLRVGGAITIAIELALCAWRGSAALMAWTIALIFSLLMLKEFFVGGWLRKHFLIYATSHMFIMPLLSLLVFSFATQIAPWNAPPWFWMYSLVGFFVTFNLEISRKIRAPEQEREGVETYTKIFGTYGAAYIVLVIRIIDSALVALAGWHLGFGAWFYIALIALYVVCLVGFFQYRFDTTPKHAKRMEIYAGMYIIAFDLLVAIALALQHGVDIRTVGA